ncbi:flagellar biosynthesis chaperone [Burkholderiales bacterium GJ-E10]|nr:flagellar biosynthesis chaperone [Burkholderiales bacterium GJ-E10]
MNPATATILLELARKRLQAAQARHANLLRTLEQARAHGEMLRRYAAEYDGRALPRAGDARDPSAERNQRAFLGRLQLAVASQEQELEAREHAVRHASEDVVQCERKLSILETLMTRRAETERLRNNRREQNHMDELAQRAFERRLAASGGYPASAIGEP